MTLHVETTMVKMFGNSVIFADHLNSLPMIFQTILFYPDWLFMTWPLELFVALHGNGSHAYLNGIGPGAIGWSIVWYIAGIVCGMFNTSRTFTRIVNNDLPFILRIPYNFVCYLLFWHIVIGRMIGVLLTRFTTWSARLSVIIERTVLTVMLIPPLLGLTFSAFFIFEHYFRG